MTEEKLTIILNKVKNSTSLDLTNRGILDTDIPTIVDFLIKKENRIINSVSFDYNNLTDQGIKLFLEALHRNNRTLNTLVISFNNLTSQVLEIFANYPSVIKNHIDLRENNAIEQTTIKKESLETILSSHPNISILFPWGKAELESKIPKSFFNK